MLFFFIRDVYIDDQGLVMQSIRYDDHSSVVHVFTRSRGHISFIVTRPRSRQSSHVPSPALLTPLSVISFQWDEKPNTTLYRLRDVHPQPSWADIPFHPVKSAVALLLADFLSHALREEGENHALYDYIVSSLCWYDEAVEGFANFHLVFLIGVLGFLGVAPETNSYLPGYCFSLETASFVPMLPSGPSVMNSSDAETFYRLATTDFSHMHLIALSHTDRARLLTYLNRYFIYHIPGFPVVKSLDVLEGLFE